ncbi:MAG: hypothetical protein QNJ45_25280 [Ardenticatenaceae bacterium]|nr:hypothetical protein [Ardenticatenaceae bacterium]
MKEPQKPNRSSYVLRCWPEQDGQGNVSWRFELENVFTRQQRGFADMAALLDFLQNQFNEPGAASQEDGGRSK